MVRLLFAAQCEADISKSSEADGHRINGLTYKDAGVDIDAGNALVEAIKPLARSTSRTGADSDLGGFGGLFDLKATGYEDPLLVACNDGVGTKLLVAKETDNHSTVGIDLVAMCVNDLVVQGAEPLFFLDYFATGKLDPEQATAVVTGIAAGCRDAGCALIGGETAEMPGLYGNTEYDLAGFAVGAVERTGLLPRSVAAGDVVIGLPSSGFHSNGYSLIRKAVQQSALSYSDPAPFDTDRSLGDALLTPTKIYVQACLSLVRADLVNGFAHITGGGLLENIPRVLPDDLAVRLDMETVPLPPMMQWLAHIAGLSASDLVRTFNCGIGMVALVAQDHVDQALTLLKSEDAASVKLGTVIERVSDGQIEFHGLNEAWTLA